MLNLDFPQTDMDLVLQISHKMPPLIILAATPIVHKIQSVFPHFDITPFISTLVDDFCDTQTSTNRLRRTITYYLDALSENDLHLRPRGSHSHEIDKRVNLVAGLDHAIVLEQAALDLLEMIDHLDIRVAKRFLIYKFHSLNFDSSVNLYRVPCETFEEFCDEMAR